MPFVQGGPPLWTWERTPDPLKWELQTRDSDEGQPVFVLRVRCGLEILELQVITADELGALAALAAQQLQATTSKCAVVAGEAAIDEAVLESFPASDPPAWTPVTGAAPHG